MAAEMGGLNVLAPLTLMDLKRRTLVTGVGSFPRDRFVAQTAATTSRGVLLSTVLTSPLWNWRKDPVRARYVYRLDHASDGAIADHEYCIAHMTLSEPGI